MGYNRGTATALRRGRKPKKGNAMEIWNYCGTTPYGEKCAQVGRDEYATKAKAEAYAFTRQIERMIGADLPEALRWKIVHNPHDFGTYYTIALHIGSDGYFTEQELAEARSYVAKVEEIDSCGDLESWDDVARQELRKVGAL